MSEFVPMTLGDLVSLQRGHDLPASTRTAGIVPVMGSFGITGWHNTIKAKGPGVTVGRSGASIGVVAFIEGDYWPLNTCMYVTDFKGNDPRFIYYFLQTINLAAHNSGSAQPSLNRNYIYPIDIEVPRPGEQREISALLGALDDKIELNRRMSVTLEEMARALYRSWFVDFDPVHARALGQPPAHMDATTTALFPDSFGPDGLPTGWGISSVNDIFDVVMGQSPPGNTYNDDGDGLPFFQGRTDFGFRYPENRKFCSAPSRIAESESVLLSVRAPVGDLNRAWERCCIGRGVASLSEKAGRTSFGYYTMWSLSAELLSYDSEGTVFGAINKKQLLGLSRVAVPETLRDRFEEIAAPIDSRIRNLTNESRTLAALRDTLLPRLMSGELRIRETEKQVEEVV